MAGFKAIDSCQDRPLDGGGDVDIGCSQVGGAVSDGQRPQFKQCLKQFFDEEGVTFRSAGHHLLQVGRERRDA